jgi:RNA polymerase sigma-70 factor (ECF subfamily)
MATLTRPFAHDWRDMKSNNPTFDDLFATHWERVYRLLYRVVGDADSAEELALDVFWQLYRTPPTLTDGDALAGWLYRVALRRGYNALRAAKRRDKYEQAAGAALLTEFPATPESEVERQMEQAQVRAVLALLKPRSAELLLLRYSGLAYKEIATTLEIAPASVGTLLARAEREFEAEFTRRTTHRVDE